MKTVLITGGSKGIGLETVNFFYNIGCSVITCARSLETWNNVVKTKPYLSPVDFQVVDLSNDIEIDNFFKYIKSVYGTIDIAINNASPALVSSGTFSEVPTSALFSTLVSDFWTHALCLKNEIKLMHSGSTIVNISSVNGIRPTPKAAMYSASKHGLEGLTRTVALEAIQQGIRINSVAPGATWTSRWEERQYTLKQDIQSEVSEHIPMKRFAAPSEITNAIKWLCSDESSYVVGHTLVVDGGLSLT